MLHTINTDGHHRLYRKCCRCATVAMVTNGFVTIKKL